MDLEAIISQRHSLSGEALDEMNKSTQQFENVKNLLQYCIPVKETNRRSLCNQKLDHKEYPKDWLPFKSLILIDHDVGKIVPEYLVKNLPLQSATKRTNPKTIIEFAYKALYRWKCEKQYLVNKTSHTK